LKFKLIYVYVFIVLKRTIIPLFFDALAKSEINSLNISFGLADEKYPSDGSCILESKDSILIINYNGIQVILIINNMFYLFKINNN